jgi:hypothetical protein
MGFLYQKTGLAQGESSWESGRTKKILLLGTSLSKMTKLWTELTEA